MGKKPAQRSLHRRAAAVGLTAAMMSVGIVVPSIAGAQSSAPSWCGLPSEQLGEDSKAVCASFGIGVSRGGGTSAPSWCGLDHTALGAESIASCQSFGLHTDIGSAPTETSSGSAEAETESAPSATAPLQPLIPPPVESAPATPTSEPAPATNAGQGALLQPTPTQTPAPVTEPTDEPAAAAPAADAPASEPAEPATEAAATESAPADVPVIVIDAGFGYIGQENGSKKWQGPLVVPGVVEDELSLDISIRVARLLEVATDKDFEVVMTREGDAAPFAPKGCSSPCEADLLGRVDMAKRVNADLFVSIRTNGHSKTSANGTETYWSPSWPGFADADLAALPPIDMAERLLAQRIHANLVELDLKDRGVKAKTYDEISYRGFPSVRANVAFHSNTAGTDGDAARLADPAFRQSAARAIFEAIEAGF